MENDENAMTTGALMTEAKAITYTTNLTPPSFEPMIGEDGKPTGKRQKTEATRAMEEARSKASVELLFRTDLSQLDEAGVKGLYQSVTEGVFGMPDTTGRFFGKRGSATDFRHNVDLLRAFFRGQYRLAEDPEAEKFRKMSWEEKFHYALEHETTGEKVKSYVRGERGAGLVETLAAGLTYSGVGLPPGAMAVARQTTGNRKVINDAEELWKEVARRSNYFSLNAEEKKQYETDVISDYEKKLTKKEPLYTYLQMAANLSDEAAYILAKSYNDDSLDVAALSSLSDDERAKVMTTFAQMRGDLTKGRILGIETDFGGGTVGDRFQMGLYGLQQSVVSLATDLYGLVEAGAMYGYAKMALDENERKSFFKAWDIQSQAKLFEEKQLPDAEGFWGEAYQSVMENAHWVIPYGGAAKLSVRGAKAAKGVADAKAAGTLLKAGIKADRAEMLKVSLFGRLSPIEGGAKYTEETIGCLLTSVDKYTRELQEIERMQRSLELARGGYAAAWTVVRGTAYASFCQEYLETADAAGISREESVLTAAIVGLINDRIERLYVPGLESTLTKGQLKSLGWNAFRRSLQEKAVGEYAKNFMTKFITEGARVGITEGWIEEPIQQLVIEHAKAVDKVEGLDAKLKAALVFTGDDLKTYLCTAIDMMPSSVGFGMTTILGQLARRRARNRIEAHRTGNVNYDEGIAGLYQQEINARRLIEAAWRGEAEAEDAKESAKTEGEGQGEGGEREGESSAPDAQATEKKPGRTEAQAEVETIDALTTARQIHERHDGTTDLVSDIAKAINVDVKTAEAVVQLLDEEQEVLRFDPRARSMVDQMFQGVVLNEETMKTILPGYVPGSLETDEEKGITVVKVNIPRKTAEGALVPGVKTIVYRRKNGILTKDDGTIDEEAVGRAVADPNLALSYATRVAAQGNRAKPWSLLSDAEKRAFAMEAINGRTSNEGTIAFRRKDGTEIAVRADAVIELATGRVADIGWGDFASQGTVRHETFHALWKFLTEILSPEEKARLADALGIERTGDWETELDEAMAHQFEEWASGRHVLRAVSSRFEAAQAWAADVFGAQNANRILDASPEARKRELGAFMGEGAPFALEPFYESVMKGRFGSGEMGIEKIVIPAKPTTAKTRTNDELPVEAAKDTVPSTPPATGAGKPEAESTPTPTPTPTTTSTPTTMERPEWDKGKTVVKRVPKKNYRIHAKLEVVNIHDGIRTSWSEGFDQENQGRDITSDDSKSLVEEIAGDPDYSKGGRVMEFTGSGAPLVSPNGDVLDGNHHMHGLQLAYQRGGEKIEKFKEQCLAEAKARGLEVSEHAAEAPIIICRVESVETKEGEAVPTIAQIAEDTNDTVQRGLNVFETAAKDARILIQHNLIPRFEIDPETGLIKDEEDKKANGQIVNPVGVFRQQSRAQGLVDESNHITEEGQKRLMNAILAALLGGTNPKVVQAIMEKTKHLDMDNEMRALMRMTPRLLALVNDPAKKDYDLRPEILEALTWYQEWRNKDEEERAKSGKNKTDWRKLTTRPTTWANYKGDMFSRPSEAAAILGDLFAAAQAERSFQSDGETDTKAGSKRAQDLIIRELGSYLDNVYATNTDTEDMFGDFTPPSKAEILTAQRTKNGRYSIALYHGTGADFERPDLTHLGEGTGVAAQGHGFYTTDARDFAEFWRDHSENKGLWDSILGRGFVYQLDYDGSEMDLCDWVGPNEEAAARLYNVAKEEGLEVRENFFDTERRTTGEKMELFLSMAKKPDGTRLTQGEMRELFIKAGIDGMQEYAGEGMNNIFVFYNTEKLKVVHKWHGRKQLYSVGMRRPSAADGIYREIRYSVKAGTKPYTAEELDKALELSGTERPNAYTKWILPDGRTPAGKAGHDFFNDELKKVTESRGFFGMMGAGAIACSDGSLIVAGKPTDAQLEAIETMYRNMESDRVDYDLYYSKYHWMPRLVDRFEKVENREERLRMFAAEQMEDLNDLDYTVSVNDEKFDELFTVTYPNLDSLVANAVKDLRAYYEEGVVPKDAQPARSLYSVGSAEKTRALEYLHAAYPKAEAKRIEGNMERLKETPWHDQVVKSLLIRRDIVNIMEGREPTPGSVLAGDKFKNLRAKLAKGKEGLFAYIREYGAIGSAAKPVNNVNSTYIDCAPSAECAKYCYALTGNYVYQNPMVKGELVSLAAELDPQRIAEIIVNEYRTTGEYDAGKALRMFDKGDIAEPWVEVIARMNKAGIHAQVFSKRPEILRKLNPKMNQVLLSIDRSNRELAAANPDLPIAYVFAGVEGDIAFLDGERARYEAHGGVILPLTNRAGKLTTDVLGQIPEWARPYVCPISSGVKKIGEWNCTKCDMTTGTGMGCFFHRTSAIFDKLKHEPLSERDNDELESLIDEIRQQYECCKGETARRGLLGWLAERLSEVRSGHVKGAEDGEDSLDAGNGGVLRNARAGRVSADQKAAGREYPDASAEIRQLPEEGAHYSLGLNRRAQYRALITKHRPDIAPEDIENILDTIGDYNSPKKEKLAVHWTVTGAITLPEDGYKIDKAIVTAKRAKVDPFHYRNPEDIFVAFPQYIPKEKPIDPKTVPQLKNPTDMGQGIVVYDVDETEKKLTEVEGMTRDVPVVQLQMRRIINTHWGKDANPWCLLQGDGEGNLSSHALHYWEHYSRLQKRVAFKDGRLLSFMGTDGRNAGFDPDYQRRWESFFAEYEEMYDNSGTDLSPLEWMERHFPDVELPHMPIAEEWWDRQDKRHDGVPIEGKIEGDPFGRWGVQEILKDGSMRLVGKRWKGSQLDGLYEEWNENDVQVEHINRRKGKLHGKVIRWYNSGYLKEEAEYKDDLPIGDHRTYDGGGRLATVEHFGENGFHDAPAKFYYLGLLSSYTEYFDRNMTKRAVRFYGDNRPQMYIEYEQPHRPGLEVHFSPRGVATRLTFISGENRVEMGYRKKNEVERFRITRKDGSFVAVILHGQNMIAKYAERDPDGRTIAGAEWTVDGHMTAAYSEGRHIRINPWNGVMAEFEGNRRLTDEEKAKVKVMPQPSLFDFGEMYQEVSKALDDAEDEIFHAGVSAERIHAADLKERGETPKYSVRLHRAKRDSILRPKSAIAQMELDLFAERKEVKGPRVKKAVDEAAEYQKFIDRYRPLYEAAIDNGDWKGVMDMAEEEGMPAASNVLKRYFREPAFSADLVGQKVSGVEDVAAILMAVRSPFVESTKAIYLDRKRQIIDAAILSVGQPDQASIARGELTRRMPPKTAYVVFSHNHPSGDPHPSNPDKNLTMSLKQELKASGVKLLDHIITDGDRYYSFNYQDVLVVNVKTPMWETVPAGKRLGQSFTHIDQLTGYVAAHLRDDGRSGHLIFLNGQNQITGVRRIPPLETDSAKLPEYVRKLALGAESVGGKRLIIDLGHTFLPDGPKRREIFQLMGPRFGQRGVSVLDIVSDRPGGGVVSYRSAINDWRSAVPDAEPVTNVERFNYPKYSIASRRVDWTALPESLDRVILSTTVAHLTGQDRFPEKYVYFKVMFRNPGQLEQGRKTVEEWAAKPETKWLGTYLLAKYYGDLEAAKAIVKHHVRHNKVSAIAEFLKRGTDKDFLRASESDLAKPVRWVYVRNDDGHVTNRIPEAYAMLLAEKFGGTVDRSVVKISDERNTGASIKARVGREFQFEGETDAGSLYIIVDDVWTTGQTAVSLMEYLLKQGADVRAITTLAVASNGSRIKPTGRLLANLLAKAHVSTLEEAKEYTGLDFNQATGSELQAYVVKGSKGVMGLEAWFGSAAPTLGLDFSKEPKPGKGDRNDLFKDLDPSNRRIRTKPTQGVFRFSTAFPNLGDLGDDSLIAAALASRLALDRKENMKNALRFETVRKMVSKAYPLLEGDALRSKTLAVQGEALKFARQIRQGLDRGVSESKILKSLNDSMKPIFTRGMQKQGREGAKIGAYGANAEAEFEKRAERIFNKAISVQAGVDTDLFEEWAGVDFVETLWKVLKNEREERLNAPPRKEETPPEDATNAGGSDEGGKDPGKYEVKELENPRTFAEYVRDLAAKYWREKHGLGKDANPWTNRIAVQFLRKTAQNVYTKLVNALTYSRSRDTALKAILKLENIPTVQGIVSQMSYIGEIIHARHIREEKEKLLEDLENLLKSDFGAAGRFKPDREELRRRVSAELELRARYMRHVLWLTPEAASEEAGELSRELTNMMTEYDEAGRDIEQSRVYVETMRKLNILREFGGLKYKTIGEVETALEYWRDLASGGKDEILAAFNEREARTKTAASLLARAFLNPKRKHMIDRGFGLSLNNYLSAHMGLASLLQDMMRYADERTRAEAEPVVEYLMREIQKAGDRSAAEMRRHGGEFHKAVEAIYRKSFKKVMAEMNRLAPEFEPFMGTKGGVKVMPTKARALQLLVSLRQGAKKGSHYYENVRKWKREGQAEEIAKLLSPEDMNMVKWIGEWYEHNRAELSAVCESLFGIGVYSEAANYFPVKMLLQRQGLEKVEGTCWTIFPKALTPRVLNERDFDTEADIFSVWASRMEEASQWKGHAKLGLELRGIFGRAELQETVAANHGKKVNALMLGFITDILAGHGAYDRTTGGIEYWSDRIRGWTALCALGGNVGVTLKQTTSIPAFGFEIGLAKTARFVFSAFTPDGLEAMKKIFNSEQRKTRWQVGNTEAVKNALARDNAGWFKKALQASMITNKLGDVVPALVVGQGIYRDCIARGMSEENAMAQTWMLIERTQQSGRMENQTSIQRRNRLGRMLYQFLTTQQQYLQYEIKAIRQMVADPSLKNAGKLTNTLLLNHLILTSLYWGMGELYKSMLGAEPPKDRLADWAVNCLLGPYASLYVLGFCTKTTLNRFLKGSWSAAKEDMLPMEGFIKRTIGDSARVLEAVFDEEKSTDQLIDELADLVSGLNPVVRDVRKVMDAKDGGL